VLTMPGATAPLAELEWPRHFGNDLRTSQIYCKIIEYHIYICI
jgi:hypothetical protein